MPTMPDSDAFYQTHRCNFRYGCIFNRHRDTISDRDAFLTDIDRDAISDTNAILTDTTKKQDNNAATLKKQDKDSSTRKKQDNGATLLK